MVAALSLVSSGTNTLVQLSVLGSSGVQNGGNSHITLGVSSFTIQLSSLHESNSFLTSATGLS